MPLQSCDSCGHAVATVDGHCRHCCASTTPVAIFQRSNLQLFVTLAPIVVLLGFLVYRMFVH